MAGTGADPTDESHADTIVADAGNDSVWGGAGSDQIFTFAGHDTIHAGRWR